MSIILIINDTNDGHTRKISKRMQEVIEQQNQQVKTFSNNDETNVDQTIFDKIVVGASIRYCKHSPHIYQFIKKNQLRLESKPNAFFSVNVVARKPEKCQPDTNPYLKKFLKQIAWKPRQLAVFAGKLDYPKYSFWDRSIIRLIMWITKGPTDPKTVKEYTNWDKVAAFGKRLVDL